MNCSICPDEATTNCPRCEHPLCAMHKPWKPELACITCEDEWEHDAWKRRIILFPAALVGLVIGLAILGLIVVIGERAGGGVFMVAAIAIPIILAMWVARKVEKKTFRRKFMNRPPTRLPRAKISKG